MVAADYTALATAVQAQIALAMPACLTVLAVILGITVGVKFIKRFVK